ncbi:sigma-70 family RNA polymerase sigma factor [Parageobacillus toebii NBRC 107807]|uniref:RNA polymerase primary sigma factor n=1 Tax=Parageobacillus toebii NBRC 107807 TaxID=1223503 RepID=A0A6G9J578_9BACL|nr:sigma-70 family RNA polymerase sigma factor [Parageobacillus toebii]MBB3870241.1 RNA polymerase primary sigma factor [Parageobacillus toebii NBRC 107807]QIQ33878.1 sigma-70 family RNA polymerase sigma factor [Parageobacillus toebii NBRC 107807]
MEKSKKFFTKKASQCFEVKNKDDYVYYRWDIDTSNEINNEKMINSMGLENEENFRIDDADFNINEFLEKNVFRENYKYKDNIDLLNKLNNDNNKEVLVDVIEKNMGLVRKIAGYYQKYMHHKLDEEDILIEGILGLIRAANRFNSNRGTQFSTYAVWWIRQSILRAIINEGFTIRIPVHAFEQIRKVINAENESYRLFQKIDVDWVCRHVGITKEKYHELKLIDSRFIQMRSLYSLVSDNDDESQLINFIPNEIEHVYDLKIEELQDPFELVHRMEIREKIMEALDKLKEREREVIIERFGLRDGQPKTLEEIGKKVGVTRERIRQIETKAIAKLRKYLKQFQLEDIY